MIHLDFETRSEIDLRKHGQHVYAEHDSTDILLASFAIEDEPPLLITPIRVDKNDHYVFEGFRRCTSLNRLYAAVKRGDIVAAFNASFERAIWDHIMVKKYGAPQIRPEQWYCVAALCNSIAYPNDLDQCTKAAQVEHKKDGEGRALMLKMCKPRKPTKSDPYRWVEGKDNLVRLGQYCQQDLLAERALYAKIVGARLDFSAEERKLWFVDQEINQRGIPVDVDTAKSAITLIKTEKKLAFDDLNSITDGVVNTANQVAAIRKWLLNNHAVPTDDLGKDTVTRLLSTSDLHPDARRVLEIRRDFGRSSTAKFAAIVDRASRDGRVRGALKFAGAGSTRRWAGQGLQPQNMLKGLTDPILQALLLSAIKNKERDILEFFYGTVMQALPPCVRGMICAPDGYLFVVVDFSGIENKILIMLSGDQKALENSQRGIDPYKTMASRIFEIPYESIEKGSYQRDVGKEAELAFGYGLGAARFEARCLARGLKMDSKLAQRAVDIYRKIEHAEVPKFWKKIERKAHLALHRESLETDEYFAFEYRNCNGLKGLLMHLPSGGRLYYPNARLENTNRFGRDQLTMCYETLGAGNQWMTADTWGGKLTENLDQALAREILAHSLVNVSEARLPIVLHVHDEIVTLEKENEANCDRLVQLMCDLPSWAKGWPIRAEGWIGKRYRK